VGFDVELKPMCRAPSRIQISAWSDRPLALAAANGTMNARKPFLLIGGIDSFIRDPGSFVHCRHIVPKRRREILAPFIDRGLRSAAMRLDRVRSAFQDRPGWAGIQRLLIAALWLSGRHAEAREAAREYVAMLPGFSLRQARKVSPIRGTPGQERYYNALRRLAGVTIEHTRSCSTPSNVGNGSPKRQPVGVVSALPLEADILASPGNVGF
jgi:hypothetical protein